MGVSPQWKMCIRDSIMTDQHMADKIYIEPLTLDIVKRIIEKERPDSLLSTLGGQTGLTLSMQLAKEGFLEKQDVRLLGARPETIDKAEDRQLFKDTMEAIGQPVIPSKVVTDLDAAMAFAEEIGYPVIVRPAFTLGGSGGGIAETPEELREIAGNGLRLSPIHQILVEKGIAGWKEIEFEVMRDSRGNVITVCSIDVYKRQIITSRRIPKPCFASLWAAERTLNHSETVNAVSD